MTRFQEEILGNLNEFEDSLSKTKEQMKLIAGLKPKKMQLIDIVFNKLEEQTMVLKDIVAKTKVKGK